jgi:uncharacterized protein (DUF1015 family)
VADVRSFAALRYDEAKAGPLESLVAPPYDVISPEEREAYLARSPYNVVHLTLPESEDEAARLWRDWQDDGVLTREAPAVWALSQTYVGPDGVERTRNGLLAALRLEPYEHGVVLPHERTHAGPKEGRLRLLRATRTQLEPIFLLHDGDPVVLPSRGPDLALDGERLWRLDAAPDVAGELLIADGHHRYETALAYHAEEGSPQSAFTLAVLVNTLGGGLTIFPTHRVFASRPQTFWPELPPDGADPQTVLRRLDDLPRDRPAVAVYEGGQAAIVTGPENGVPDAQFVDRLGHEGISYTPNWQEAVRAVDDGEAAVAVLMRPTRIEDVFAVAQRGETMPQKSTYFYPKLVSGLLFLPL